MLDDEIVFLGSSSGLAHHTPSPAQRPVTGIALHIEKQGSIEGYGMLFRRASTSVVHIGRRSGFESSNSKRSQDHEQQGDAMFRCAVVSRKHAKIAFSDSGHAYLIDLGSHHGTHVRKPGDKFSKIIKSETPTLLADGDIVTFGKTVGKGDECVRPIVARIELLHGQNSGTNPTSTPFKPLVVPSPSSSSGRSAPKSASGRYGVNQSPSSSSDESYSSNSGIYSDIEEIPPPTSSSKPAARESQSNAQSSSGSLGGSFSVPALNVLKRLLPPTHRPSTPRRLPSVTEIVERPLSFFFGPESVPTSPTYSPKLLSRPLSSSGISELDFAPLVGFDAAHHDIYEHDVEDGSNSNKSRSNSPMDLASPSPAAEVVVSRSLSIPPPPLLEVSPHLSPRNPDPPAPDPPVAGSDSQSADMDIPLVNSPEGSSASGSSGNSPLSDFAAVVGGAYTSVAPWEMRDESEAVEVIEPPAPAPALAPTPVVATVTPAQLKNIEETLQNLKADVAKLQSHRKKYKARFNSNVHVISEKLTEFDDRLMEVNTECAMLVNQLDNVVHVEVPDLNAQLEAVQEKVDDFIEEANEREMEREQDDMEKEEGMDILQEKEEAEKEDVKKTLEALQAAVKEMQEFRETTKKQIEEELAAMKALHQTTADRLVRLEQDKAKEATAPASEVRFTSRASTERCFTVNPSRSPQTPVLTSLKRKRDDTDENEDEVEEQCESVNENAANEIVVDANADKDKDEVMDFDDVPSADLRLVEMVAAAARAPDAPPPRKRARRFASVVAQTVTAVTIGAVVTWSALAFT